MMGSDLLYLLSLAYSQGPVPVRCLSVLIGVIEIINSTYFIELLLYASPLKANSPLFFVFFSRK